ncbi:hypothetical protein [Streptomyces griseosporeus]|uniref:hypothetical protein n=1 Tax=Streptomyces griseosporeus TaxID=1910 RepID=UPI0036FB92A1
MEHGTDRHSPQPSPTQAAAEHVLALAANLLGEHPADHAMTDEHLDAALRSAQSTVLDTVRPRSAHASVRALVRAMLPPVAGTVGAYANRLRNAAVTA